jgi:hypothetical protein
MRHDHYMFCSCTPEIYEPHRHVLSPHVSRGYADQQNSQPDTPLSVRVVQSLGFQAIYTGGYMTGAHTAITEPLLTLTKQVGVAKQVVHTTDRRVITDAGTGYGDSLHVMRCVREFEEGGSFRLKLSRGCSLSQPWDTWNAWQAGYRALVIKVQAMAAGHTLPHRLILASRDIMGQAWCNQLFFQVYHEGYSRCGILGKQGGRSGWPSTLRPDNHATGGSPCAVGRGDGGTCRDL